MKIRYREIEPIEERPAIHKSHIADNTFDADSPAKMELIEGSYNRFPIVTNQGHATLLRPYEKEIKDDITKIISQMKDKHPQVHIHGIPIDEINKYFNIRGEESSAYSTWYQNPLPKEVYQKKLKKFKNKGLEFKIISEEDILQLKELVKKWSNKKKTSAFATFNLDKIESPKDISEAIAKLESLQTEVEWMDFKEQEDGYYKKKMSQPITTYYGAFKDEKLIAYSEIQANCNFASFDTRAALRQNSFSPQEFVDYNIMKKLSEEGIKIIDRGPLHIRKGADGLMDYKKKFGPLKIQRQLNQDNISIINDPLFDMAKEMQGDPFK